MRAISAQTRGAGQRIPRRLRVAARRVRPWICGGWAAFALLALCPVYTVCRYRTRPTTCQSNLKQLALATLMYAQDYDDRLPVRRNWSDGIYPYLKNRSVYVCPSASDGAPAPNVWPA